MALSPLLQLHYLHYCSEVVPATAVELLNATFGRRLTNASQARRLEEHYGRLTSVEQELQKPLVGKELQLDHNVKGRRVNNLRLLTALFCPHQN
jgi:hypothetical protein